MDQCPVCGGDLKKCVQQAGGTAVRLLWEHLTASQRYTFWWKGVFVVPDVPYYKSKRHTILADFVIAMVPTYGIMRLDATGKCVVNAYCAIPGLSPLMYGDMLLAQKLWLESAPRSLLRVANTNTPSVSLTREIESYLDLMRDTRCWLNKPERPESLRESEFELVGYMSNSGLQHALRTRAESLDEGRYWWQKQPKVEPARSLTPA